MWFKNSCDDSCCMFVSSQVDILLAHPHFLLIVPLYVLLGRCSVILSRAGCLYDPSTEIWLARLECLSFFSLHSLLSLLLLSSGFHCHCSPHSSPLRLFACLPHPLWHCTSWWYKFSIKSRCLLFFMFDLAFPSSIFFLPISGYCLG